MIVNKNMYEMWQQGKDESLTLGVQLGKGVGQIGIGAIYRQNGMFAGLDKKTGIYHPIGHYIIDGKLTKYYKELPWSAVVIPNTGKPYIARTDISKLVGVKTAFYGTPSILDNGVVFSNHVKENTAPDIWQGSNYRSILAISNWGYLALIRTKTKMTLKQAGQLAKGLGYTWAVNLDGGGSVSGGAGDYDHGYERPVSSALVVVSDNIEEVSILRENDISLSKNLKLYELECKDGSHQVITFQKLVDCFQRLRDRVGQALVVNSGYRTPAYNKSIGGEPDSYHIQGKAMDLALPKGLTVDQFALLGREAGFTGVGKYPWGCHFDIRDIPTTFDRR